MTVKSGRKDAHQQLRPVELLTNASDLTRHVGQACTGEVLRCLLGLDTSA